jgi:hypothetical protein
MDIRWPSLSFFARPGLPIGHPIPIRRAEKRGPSLSILCRAGGMIAAGQARKVSVIQDL